MSEEANVPPLFRLHVLAPHADAGAQARTQAAQGAPPASLYWCKRPDRLSCAVVLAPEQPLREAAQMLFIGQLGLGDALSSCLPPMMDISFVLPEAVLLDRAVVARTRLSGPEGMTPDAVPDWLVLVGEVAVKGVPGDNSAAGKPVETTLENDNCGAVSAANLVGAFARHLLSWIDRWQRDGFSPVRKGWVHRVQQHDKQLTLNVDGATVSGTYLDVGEDGEIHIETKAGKSEIPAWRLVR